MRIQVLRKQSSSALAAATTRLGGSGGSEAAAAQRRGRSSTPGLLTGKRRCSRAANALGRFPTTAIASGSKDLGPAAFWVL